MSFKKFLTEQEIQKQSEKEDIIMGSIIDSFSTHDSPNDTQIHDLAKQLGIDDHVFEEKIYQLLSSFLSKGLRNKVDKQQLEVTDEDVLNKAIKVELEHTEDTPMGRAIARNIVMDHVAEYGWKYYEELQKMEERLKK